MGRSSRSSQPVIAPGLAADLRAVLSKLRRRLREHGGGNDLTPSQASVLLRLEKDGPATVSSLARAEGMRPQSMSAIITSLQKAGLVAGSPDPDDGRKMVMALSKKCMKWLEQARAAKQDWLAASLQKHLSAQEQVTVAVAITLLARLVED